MKQIVNYIYERLHLTSKQQYSCQPKTKDELQEIIIQRIKDDGPECDLNDIDVSKIEYMSNLFNANTNYDLGNEIFKDFNGDISLWNVSNVKHMYFMFCGCEQFNCDISKWDVSNVINMGWMFDGCKEFNCDISRWDVSNVKNMNYMFCKCEQFKCDLSSWDVSNVKDIDMCNTFKGCPTKPKWYRGIHKL